MDEMHSLLKRQLEQCFGASFSIPEAWQGFVSAVNDAYWESDTDRGVCEYSLEMNSQELLQRNIELQAIFQAIPDLLLRLNSEGTILTYEAGGTTDFFLRPEELIGKRLQDISLGGMGERFREAIQQVQEAGTLVSVEYTLTRDDQTLSYEARLSPLLEDQIIVIMRNITAQVQTEAQIRCLKEFNENIIQSMTEGIVVEDAEGYFTFVNPAAAKLLGYTPAELIGLHWTTVIPPGQHAVVEAADERRMRGESDRYELELLRKDGGRISVQVSGNPRFEEGHFVGTIAVFADLTERKQTEEALRENEELLDSILTASAVGIAHVKDRKILWANEAMTKLFGFTEEEQYLRRDTRILYVDEKEYRRVGELIYEQPGSDRMAVFDAEFKRYDSSRFDGHVRITTLDPHDPMKGIIVSIIDITERKRVEEALRTSRQRYRSLFDGVPVGLYRTTPQGKILDANLALVEMLGYPDQETLLAAQACDLYVDSEDRIRWQTLMEQAGLVHNFQTRLRRYDGAVIWVEDNARIVQGPEGQVLHYEGSLRDITEQKLAEEALRVSEERYRLLADNVADMIWTMDLEMRFTYVSPSVVGLLGYAPEEIMGKRVNTILAPDSLVLALETFEKEMTTERLDLGNPSRTQVLELEVVCKGGSTVWTECKMSFLRADNQAVGILGVARDITERQRAEEALRESEERWHLLYENLPGGSFVVNRQYIIEDVNDILCAVTGFTREELIGQSCNIICPKGPHKCPIFDFGEKRIDNDETAVRTKDGGFVPIIKSARRISVADQEIIVENFQDITERIRAEEELKKHRDHLEDLVRDRTAELIIAKEQAEAASQAKSAFLASMSHELRTPLNAILGYAQVLQQRSLDEEIIDSLNTIQQSGEHLLTLINDVLDISRIETGKMVLHPDPLPFSGFLENIANIIRSRADAKGITFTFEKLSVLPVSVYADETRLRQILLNLLDNAVKFTEVGGVTLRVKSKPAPAASSTVNEIAEVHHAARITFQVEDTGIGIPADQLERIFQPFEQAEEVTRWTKGAGLGLAISRQLVRLMGGEIYVESPISATPPSGARGGGSRFWFKVVLPVIEKAAELVKPSEQVITSYKGSRRAVLVVDDIPSNRAVLVKLLSSLGFEVLEAADGQQALHLARELRPDLILMDRWMPVMDGFEAVRLMRQIPELAEVPVITVSASVSQADQAESREAGVDGFLPKPVDWSDLLALLEENLGLVWEVEAEEAGGLDDLCRVGSKDKQEETALVPPPEEEMKVLLDLAMRGNLRAIQERLAELESMGDQYLPFVSRLRELVKGFEEQKILALIKEYMKNDY